MDIKDGRVVKGVNFVGLQDVGDPVEFAKAYESQNADEVVLLDITATTEGRDTVLPALIARAASELTIPVAVGGGIRSLEDFETLLRAGAAKVAVNSAAVDDPELIRAASTQFGSKHVVAAVDAKTRDDGSGWNVVTKGGTYDTGLDLVDWAREVERLGAGEILLTSLDRDGTRDGFDLDMTQAVCAAVDIPVVASGGCGGISDIVELFKRTDADAALAASLFHFGEATVGQVKATLAEHDVPTFSAGYAA